jgi:hypothetical protein
MPVADNLPLATEITESGATIIALATYPETGLDSHPFTNLNTFDICSSLNNRAAKLVTNDDRRVHRDVDVVMMDM